MKNLILFITTIVLFSACSFRTPHERFIDDVDTTVRYGDFNKYKDKFYEISDKYLINTKYDNSGNTIYYYNWTDKEDSCPCKYHVIVNPKGIMIDWGFDECDKEKCCRLVG